MDRSKVKWLFTALAFVVFLLLGGAIPDDPLGERAMAVGLGVDCDESGNVIACAQILTPSPSADSDSGTRVVSAKGKLLNTAVSNLTELCEQTLTVTHCNVVLLGERLIDSGDAVNVLFTLLENTYVSDNAYVFACEGTPQDVFATKSAFGQNASRYLQQLITTYGTYENIAYRTLSQILVGHESLGKTTYMPYVTKRPVLPSVPSSSSPEDVSSSSDYAYDLTAVLILKNAKKVGVYGENALRAINYLLTEVHRGSEDFDVPSGKVGFFILDNRVKESVSLSPLLYSVQLEIGVTVKDYRPPENQPRRDGVFTFALTPDDKKACERRLHDEISSFFNEMREKNADVFCLQQKFFSKFARTPVDLSAVSLSLSVTLCVEK